MPSIRNSKQLFQNTQPPSPTGILQICNSFFSRINVTTVTIAAVVAVLLLSSLRLVVTNIALLAFLIPKLDEDCRWHIDEDQ